MSSCFIYFQCCQKVKTKSEISILNKFAVNTYFRLNYNSGSIFKTLRQVQRKFPYSELFKCAVEACPPNLQLEVINLHCNDVLKGIKYQREEVIGIL